MQRQRGEAQAGQRRATKEDRRTIHPLTEDAPEVTNAKELMKTADQLYAIANADRDEQHTALAIYGLCEQAADGKEFMCKFDRAEYVISDFDHMRNIGCVVEWDCGTIYVRWA